LRQIPKGQHEEGRERERRGGFGKLALEAQSVGDVAPQAPAWLASPSFRRLRGLPPTFTKGRWQTIGEALRDRDGGCVGWRAFDPGSVDSFHHIIVSGCALHRGIDIGGLGIERGIQEGKGSAVGGCPVNLVSG
jgi:hypothetical protein